MKRPKFTLNQVFILLTLAVILALVLPDLLRHGMFMDGTMYAIISKNYAIGKGTFWYPFLSYSSETHGQNAFLEHPPLIYFLQSFFFKIGGDSFLCERMYCLFTLIIGAFLIARIWMLINSDNEVLKNYFWLPVLLWIIIPTVNWAFKNNMHENTLSIFVLGAVYFLIYSVRVKENNYIFVVLAGIFIFLASFSKGLPGFFPLTFYIIYKFCFKNITWKKTIGNTFLVVLTPVLIYFLIVSFSDDAYKSLSFHLKERLVYRIFNNPQVENRFVVIFWFLCDMIVPILLVLLIKGILYLKIKSFYWFKEIEQKQYFFLFLFLGLVGVLPLCLTKVQRAVYYVPSLPYFAIALSFIVLKDVKSLAELLNENKAAQRSLEIFSVTALAISITYSVMCFGKTLRDQTELEDVRKIASVTGNNVSVCTSKGIYYEWGFQFYLLRYNEITLKTNWEYDQYILLGKEEKFSDVNYEKVNIDLNRYNLYQKIKGH
jgi:hypothetical protein